MRRSVWSFVGVLALASPGCDKFEDCRLYNTCSGDDLLELASKELDVDGGRQCFDCLSRECEQNANTCSRDVECNFTARCRLKSSPVDYQDCLVDLNAAHFSSGTEAQKPWEGEPLNVFAKCVHDKCPMDCGRARYACDISDGSYGKIDLLLAVRKYSGQSPMPFAAVSAVSACACDRRGCFVCHDADKNGVIPLLVDFGRIRASDLYFELRPTGADAAFPPTLYYPRRLGAERTQLVAVYLVSSEDVASGNAALGYEASVLSNASQSLFLPDSCIWEENSVPNMRLSVERVGPEKFSAPQCNQLPTCQPPCGQPCVWYAGGQVPQLVEEEQTDGTGAGVAGLPEGTYRVRATDGQGHGSSRTVLMRNGWMTIARLWPTTP